MKDKKCVLCIHCKKPIVITSDAYKKTQIDMGHPSSKYPTIPTGGSLIHTKCMTGLIVELRRDPRIVKVISYGNKNQTLVYAIVHSSRKKVNS